MAFMVPGGGLNPVDPSQPAAVSLAYSEARVAGALNILEQEAGLSDDTMSTLRQAVESGMSRRRDAAVTQQANATAAAQHAIVIRLQARATPCCR